MQLQSGPVNIIKKEVGKMRSENKLKEGMILPFLKTSKAEQPGRIAITESKTMLGEGRRRVCKRDSGIRVSACANMHG